MEIIKKDEFDKAEELPEPKPDSLGLISGDKFKEMMEQFKNPVDFQREIAARIKSFLDVQIQRDLEKFKFLSDLTRRWVRQFNDMCDSIQKAYHGDKSVNLHLHKVVSHGQVAAKIRRSKEENEVKTRSGGESNARDGPGDKG